MKVVFIKYPEHSKRYVMYQEHPNNSTMEIGSYNVVFLRDEFISIDEIKKVPELYEL